MSRARGNEAVYVCFGINHLYELAFFQADLPKAWPNLTIGSASFHFHHLLMFVILILTMFIIVFILLMNDQ